MVILDAYLRSDFYLNIHLHYQSSSIDTSKIVVARYKVTDGLNNMVKVYKVHFSTTYFTSYTSVASFNFRSRA